jgi:ubiquinone/menaquinone biosynthesis C-methylase UbiE
MKLEIGPGDNPMPGEWETIGYEAKWGEQRLPFDDNTFDEVYASHVLEHVPWYNTVIALRDVHRILKPGGLAEFWVPNFEFIVQCYLDRRCGDHWRRKNQDGHYMNWVQGRLFTYGPGPDNWHHAAFDSQHLTKVMQEAGFANPVTTTKRTRGTSHGNIDLGVKATK